MPAYIIANIEVTDPDRYETYKRLAQEAIAAHGGRYIVRGGESEVVEGAFLGSRFVIVEFPARTTAETFVRSADYARARAAREGAAVMNMVVVEGLGA
jgi:uncharacterized protein (DUF1330 family)